MSSTWNGVALQAAYLRKYGFRDTSSATRVLGWINDIQRDIASSHTWSFLKFKMKKEIISGDQEIDISPTTPARPAVVLFTGGAIATNSILRVKTTFVLFDESGKEINSLESEPSLPSVAVTTSGSSLGITVPLEIYQGDTTLKPTIIHRRVYLKVDANPYYLVSEIENNTATTVNILAAPSSLIEPPEYSLVSFISADDPLIEKSGIILTQSSLEEILEYDPNLSSSGTPTNYARITPNKILLYPKPSETLTLTYWVYRVPSRIFADEDRPIQLHHSLKEALDAGVTWKGYEDKDQDGQESKKENYLRIRNESKGIMGRVGGNVLSVKVVC